MLFTLKFFGLEKQAVSRLFHCAPAITLSQQAVCSSAILVLQQKYSSQRFFVLKFRAVFCYACLPCRLAQNLKQAYGSCHWGCAFGRLYMYTVKIANTDSTSNNDAIKSSSSVVKVHRPAPILVLYNFLSDGLSRNNGLESL